MKRFFSIVMAVGIVSAFWGCDSFAKLSDSGKTSQGDPYELVVVSNNQVWDGIVGDTLRSILRQPVPSINQYEPLFDVMRVTPDGFKNVIARHRNILKLLVDSKVPRDLRSSVLFAAAGNEILWMIGADSGISCAATAKSRFTANYKISQASKKVLILEIGE